MYYSPFEEPDSKDAKAAAIFCASHSKSILNDNLICIVDGTEIFISFCSKRSIFVLSIFHCNLSIYNPIGLYKDISLFVRLSKLIYGYFA